MSSLERHLDLEKLVDAKHSARIDAASAHSVLRLVLRHVNPLGGLAAVDLLYSFIDPRIRKG